MEIIDEGALDKELMVPEKTQILNNLGRNGPRFIKPSSPFDDCCMHDYDDILE